MTNEPGLCRRKAFTFTLATLTLSPRKIDFSLSPRRDRPLDVELVQAQPSERLAAGAKAKLSADPGHGVLARELIGQKEAKLRRRGHLFGLV